MRVSCTVIIVLISIFLCGYFGCTFAVDLLTRSIDYSEDFETSDPFQYWTSDGTYTLNYKGLSKFKASSGSSSFKLDLNVETATYFYLKVPIRRIPTAGHLQFTGDLHVESTDGATVALGVNVDLSPARMSGISVLDKIGNPTSGWITQAADLVASGARVGNYLRTRYFGAANLSDLGIWTNMVGLFVYAPKGGRIILYVDNIRIKGSVPDEADYNSLVTAAWQGYLTRVQSEVSSMANSVLGYDGGYSGPKVKYLVQSAKSQATKIKDTVQQKGYPSPDEYSELRSLSLSMEFLAQYVSSLRDHSGKNIVTFPYRPIQPPMHPQQILPSTIPGFAIRGESIFIQACRGEYEPASFVVRAERPLSDIQLVASDLIGPDQRKIPASAVDIKLIKCWYQAGEGTIYKTDKRVLTPELLLNDDRLVKVDYAQKKNYLRITSGGIEQYIGISLPDEIIPDDVIIKDANVLQPFDLDAETNKQVWVTVHIPESAVAGDYKGTIRLQTAGTSLTDMNLTITVLPFDLQPSFLECAIYYRGKLPTSPKKGINSEWKTSEQYLTELQNMKNHGVLYPTLYQRMDEMLGAALSLRNKAGLPKDNLYSAGITTGNPISIPDLNALGNNVATWIRSISEYGFRNLYVYGIDEASGEKLASQRAAWQKVKECGAKVFTSGHKLADIVGDLLDAAILSGSYDPSEVIKFHNNGKKVFSYGNPQVGIENPEVYRRNYGLALAAADYDGAMDYAYQHSFGHIWNDFDHARFRDHVFAYPTNNGVIDTIQWEGFREAVDDVRYLATLIAIKDGQKEQILCWLRSVLSDQVDTHELRNQIVNEITKQRNVSD